MVGRKILAFLVTAAVSCGVWVFGIGDRASLTAEGTFPVTPSLAQLQPLLTPQFSAMSQFETTTVRGDPVDLYYPSASDRPLPVALFLQGLNVDKAYYSDYAQQVGRYGFVVAVPNHRTSIRGREELFAQVGQVTDILATMKRESEDPRSPLFGKLALHTLVLLGHSHGGMMGLDAIRGACDVPFCMGDYTLPEELKAAVFYGTFLWEDGEYLSVDNSQIPVALIAGSRDSLITPEETQRTYEHIQDPPKVYIRVEGANHYGITDQHNPPGAPIEPRRSEIPQAMAVETIARWSGAFLRAYALNDETALNYLRRQGGGRDKLVTLLGEF